MRIRKATQRWFKVPGDPDGAEILIKSLTPGERYEIFDKAFTQEIIYVGPDDKNPQFKQINDKSADRMATAQAAVADWRNVFAEDGTTPLECTPENIELAVNGIDGFLSFVRECMRRLDDDIEAEREGQEKN